MLEYKPNIVLSEKDYDVVGKRSIRPDEEGSMPIVRRLACAIPADHGSRPLCEGRFPCSNWS